MIERQKHHEGLRWILQLQLAIVIEAAAPTQQPARKGEEGCLLRRIAGREMAGGACDVAVAAVAAAAAQAPTIAVSTDVEAEPESVETPPAMPAVPVPPTAVPAPPAPPAPSATAATTESHVAVPANVAQQPVLAF